MAAYRFIGQPIARIEDAALLTGAGRFVDDVAVPDALEAAFVRSAFAHARIRSIDVAAARAAPGVHAVLTCADIRPLLTQDRMPLELRVEILPPGDGDKPVSTDLRLSPGVTGDGGLRVGLDHVLEVRLPCSLGARAALSFRIALLDADGRTQEAIPEDGWVRFRPPGPASSPASLRRARQGPA